MSYRIMARNSHVSTAFAKPTALEAFQAICELRGEGYHLTAVIDDVGNAVPVQKLEELAANEGEPSH